MEVISLKDIIQNIIVKAKKYSNKYKSSWINSNTDLYFDLKLSKSEIIEIILELEKEYDTHIISMPLSVPSFKIVFVVSLKYPRRYMTILWIWNMVWCPKKQKKLIVKWKY